MNSVWRALVDDFEREFKEAFDLCYPHRYNCPGGYASPRLHAMTFYGMTQNYRRKMDGGEPSVVHDALAILSAQMLARKVPTYFVDGEFADMVAHMRLPAGLTTAQVNWPLDTFLFVLPEAFSRRHFGRYVAYISAASITPGLFPRDRLKPAQEHVLGIQNATRILNTARRTVISGSVVPDKTDPANVETCIPADYSVSFPDTFVVDKLSTLPFEETALVVDEDTDTIFTEHRLGASAETADMSTAIAAFTIKLLLVLSTRAHTFIQTTGAPARPAKIKQGRVVQTELWSPSFIGRGYRVKRTFSAPGSGTHASPRPHWRWGHFAHVFKGKRGEVDFVSAGSLPRTPDNKIDWSRVTDEQREAFWKNHELKLIDSVFVDGTGGAHAQS